jgi:hypothetical protein
MSGDSMRVERAAGCCGACDFGVLGALDFGAWA